MYLVAVFIGSLFVNGLVFLTLVLLQAPSGAWATWVALGPPVVTMFVGWGTHRVVLARALRRWQVLAKPGPLDRERPPLVLPLDK
jgi:hypothetical protein